MPRCRGDRNWLPRAARRVEELVGDVGEELIDVNAGVEFGELGEELGGEVFRVVLTVHWKDSGSDCLGVTETKARMRWQA